jgi:hypothetical protein
MERSINTCINGENCIKPYRGIPCNHAACMDFVSKKVVKNKSNCKRNCIGLGCAECTKFKPVDSNMTAPIVKTKQEEKKEQIFNLRNSIKTIEKFLKTRRNVPETVKITLDNKIIDLKKTLTGKEKEYRQNYLDVTVTFTAREILVLKSVQGKLTKSTDRATLKPFISKLEGLQSKLEIK